jgi:pimeloyl-ACP methyl ester carboxylesterase
MHVYSEGRGGANVVLLPGWGNPCPAVDFQPLIKALRDDYRVTVVDYYGYGWSDGTKAARTNAAIVEETRAALLAAGIEPPYILLPHSLSGIYALYYSRSHPEEIRAIINLDSSFPALNAFSKPPTNSPLKSLLRVSGLLRVILAFDPGISGYGKPEYSEAELALLSAMICRNLDNATQRLESDAIYANRAELVGLGYPRTIPVAMILAEDSIAQAKRLFGGMDWVEEHKDQVAGNVDGSVYALKGGHNLYRSHADAIADIVKATAGR